MIRLDDLSVEEAARGFEALGERLAKVPLRVYKDDPLAFNGDTLNDLVLHVCRLTIDLHLDVQKLVDLRKRAPMGKPGRWHKLDAGIRERRDLITALYELIGVP